MTRLERTRGCVSDGIFDSSPVAIAVVRGPERRVAAGNRALLRLVGLPPAALLGCALAEVVPEPGREALRDALEEAQRTDQEVARDVEHGVVTWRWWVHPLEPEDGLEGLIVHALDVTTEVRLTSQAAQLEAILEGMADAVLVVDTQGRFVRVNRAARALLDAPAPGRYEDLKGLDLRAASGAPLPFEDWPLSRALRGDLSVDTELLLVRRTGELHHLVVSTRAVPVAAQQSIIVAVAHDLTAVRRVERERDEALALLSHDLRTPLGTIALRAELLKERLADHARAAEQILSGVQRIAAMTEELAQASCAALGPPLRLEPIDLLTVVSTAVERVTPPGRRDLVSVAAPGPAPRVKADAERLERAVANLAANAFKFSAPDAPVEVRIERRGREAVIVVEDHGKGIAPADLSRLFQRTFRGAAEGSGVDGLGLGLYIVRRVAEAHGGRVWVESQLGQGSAFHLALPAVE